MDISAQHVVITGGGSGVGADMAHVFRNAGAKVTVIGRRIEPLNAVAETTGAYAATADVTDPDALSHALAQARKAQGPITVAIANAGAAPSAPFAKITPADFAATLAVNLTGVFNLWQATQPDMIAQGHGRMIAIASTAGLKGYPYVAPYCAAKHGVVGLTRALAIELARKNITVNAICPSFIKTPLLERSLSEIMEKTGITRDAAEKSLIAGNPQARFVETREVSDTALWLCSDSAASINGHALALSGGEV